MSSTAPSPPTRPTPRLRRGARVHRRGRHARDVREAPAGRQDPGVRQRQRVRRGRHGDLRGDHQPDPAVDPGRDRRRCSPSWTRPSRARDDRPARAHEALRRARHQPGASWGVRRPSWCSSWCWSSRRAPRWWSGARIIPVEAIFDSAHRFHGIADVRVDRTLLGLAVGAALGLVGALMQGLTRNPLADPGILGINAGAVARDGAGDLDVRLLRPAHLRLVRASPAPPWRWCSCTLVAALGRDGATPDEDRHRRRRAHRGGRRRWTAGRAAHRPPDHRGVPALVRSAPSAAATPTCCSSGCRSSWWAPCWGSASIGSLNAARARRRPRPRVSGRRAGRRPLRHRRGHRAARRRGDGAGRADRLRRA